MKKFKKRGDPSSYPVGGEYFLTLKERREYEDIKSFLQENGLPETKRVFGGEYYKQEPTFKYVINEGEDIKIFHLTIKQPDGLKF